MEEKTIKGVVIHDSHGNVVDEAPIYPQGTEELVSQHNADQDAHPQIQEAVTGIRTQVERRLVGAKVTFSDGHTEDVELGFNGQGEVILLLPKETFGKIDGVKVNGEELPVDNNGKVDITIPTNVTDLEDAEDYATKEEAQAMVDEAKVTGASVDYQEDGGSPSATVDFSEGSLGFTLKNMKMKFSELTNDEKEELRGPQGIPGEGAIWTGSGEEIMTLKQETGYAINKAMSQKAITELTFARTIDTNYLQRPPANGYISTGPVYKTGNGNYKYLQCHVESLRGMTLRIEPQTENQAMYAFTKNAFANNESVIYADEDNLAHMVGKEIFVKVPQSATYLFISTLKNNEDTSCKIFVVDTANEELAKAKNSEYVKMTNAIANGESFTLDINNISCCEIFIKGKVLVAAYNSIGKYADIHVETTYMSNAIGSVVYKIPVEGISWVELYVQVATANKFGFVFVDENDYIVHYGGSYEGGMGAAIVPPNAKYLLYRYYDSNYKVILHPKNTSIPKAILQDRTKTIGIDYPIKLHYYRTGSNQNIGDNFFAAQLELAGKSVTVGDISTTVDMYLVDVEGYDFLDLKSFQTAGNVGNDIIDEKGNVLVHIKRLVGANELVSNIAIPKTAKWLIYHVYRHQEDTLKYVKLYSKELNRPSIRVLYIGNSLTQDCISYTPMLLRELAPNVDFKFYDWYVGGFTLAEHYEYFENNTPARIFSVCENDVKWTNYDNSKTMASILADYEFDVVVIQEYMNMQETISVDAFNNIVSYIREHYGKPFKVACLLHPPKRSDIAAVYERTVAENVALLRETEAASIISPGSAIVEAMNTSLDSMGDQSHLSPDGTHAQEGLPCLLQAYVNAMWIFRQIGLPFGIVNSKLRITTDIYNQINVPGPNLGTGVVTGTDAQHMIAQRCAIKADKIARVLEFNALSELISL